ncbi:MAG: hypothetical protein KJP16_14680 [Gammaproteobacteria bacterium]|nr:hypothetical protein [Gammaproteobacteria bacterium]NNL52047.1 hypothetical protein [Woeseiaceae bacterium]
MTISFILIAVFTFGIVISYLSATDLFIGKGYLTLRRCLYMVLPLLFIRDLKMLGRVNSAIVIIAVIGALTGLLASLGIISPVVQRISDTRIGLETLPKAVGLFSNYGDVAMLTCYTMLMVIAIPRQRFLFGYGMLLVKLIVVACLVVGFLGLQSRNILLTTIMGILAYFALRFVYKRPPMLRVVAGAALAAIAITGLVGVSVFSSELIELLKNWGGRSASASAAARLYQYEAALSVMNESLISGVDLETYRRVGYILDGIHNMWLYLMVQGGMISVMAMITLILRALIGALRNVQGAAEIQPEAYAGAALVFGMLVATMFYAGAGEVYWFLLGVVTSISIVYVNPVESGAESKDKKRFVQPKIRRVPLTANAGLANRTGKSQ